MPPFVAEDDKDSAQWEAVEEAAELLAEEKYQDALYALRDVARADPTNAYAFHLMGTALYEVGQLEPAREAYRAAVRLAPAFLGARSALAGVLRALRDYRGALREGQEALRQAPADPDALYTMGLSYAALGARTEAARYLDAFLETKPELEAAMEVRQMLEMLKLASGPFEVN
jgi:tetratricopeptide (TPR) repeat protein